MMKALSIRQPWAHFIVAGIKKIENRSTLKNFRGKFLIHASKSYDQEGESWIKKHMGYDELKEVQVGGIIGMAEIYDCVTESDDPWFFGPNGFLIRNPVWVPFHPCPGKLGFWDCEHDPELGNTL